MAHNLNETNGKVSFAGTKPAWHGLGQIVKEAMTAEQAINLAGLGYEVLKTPALVTIDDKIIEVPEKFATYRKDTGAIFGIVGNRYEIVQNKDAFNFFDAIIGAKQAIYETAGALGQGERIFITAKMPEFIRIEGTDDLTEVYVMLTNSHDGSGSVIAAVTPVRIVCQNTLNAALKNTTNRVSVRHTTNVNANLENAHKLLGITHKYIEQLNECFNVLARKSITDAQVKELVAALFKSEKEDSTRIKNIREAVMLSYHTGVGQESIRGTAWGALNGITHYLDHVKEYKDADAKFSNVIEGTGAKLTEQATSLLLAM